MEWQPIETAPLGVYIIAAGKDPIDGQWRVATIFGYADEEWWEAEDNTGSEFAPFEELAWTHWMPLPPPPEAK